MKPGLVLCIPFLPRCRAPHDFGCEFGIAFRERRIEQRIWRQFQPHPRRDRRAQHVAPAGHAEPAARQDPIAERFDRRQRVAPGGKIPVPDGEGAQLLPYPRLERSDIRRPHCAGDRR